MTPIEAAQVIARMSDKELAVEFPVFAEVLKIKAQAAKEGVKV